ncbi:MAG: hypothetical protein WC208_10575 [Gallionella sp.]|jgi:hypothetical protein
MEFTRGTTATFYCTFARLTGEAVDPTSPVVGIWSGATQIVPDIAMTRVSTGYYIATWAIPAAQTLGAYVALYSAVIDGITCQGSEEFEIVAAASGVVPLITGYYCTWDDVKACLIGLDVGDMASTYQTRMENFYIPNLKNEIDTYCRQNFDKTTVTQFYDGCGTDKIVLNRRPVILFKNCILRVIPSISWYQFRRWRQINVIDSEGIAVATQGGPEPINSTVTPPYSPTDYTWETDITKADLFVDCSSGILTIPPRILYLEMQAIPFWNYTFLPGNANIEVTYDYGYETTAFPNDLRMAAAMLVACQMLRLKGMGVSAGANSITMDGVARNFGGMPYQAFIDDMRKQAYMTLDRFRRIDLS